MIKHVIFDCDGVLVDTELVAAQVVVEKLKHFDIEITVDHYIKTYTGATFSGTYKKLLPELNEDHLSKIVEESEISVYDNLVPIQDMEGIIKSINLPKSVVSNSFLWQVEKAMRVTGYGKYFNNLLSAEMVKNPKPAPDVYLLAAQKANALPKECLVIEDSLSGASAALKAGMKVIGFTGGSHILPGHEAALIKKGVISTANEPNKLLLQINELILPNN